MKRSITLIICLLGMLTVEAQKKKFYPGTLVYANGKEVKALIKTPADAGDKTIEYKLTEDGKKESASSEELKSFTLSEGNTKFVRTAYFEMGGKKQAKYAGWFNILREGDVILYSNNYDDFSGREVMSPAGSHDIIFLVKRTKEEVPTVIGLYFPSMMNHNQLFRKHSAEYFSDYPELAKRLEGKEFKFEDIGQVVDLYNNRKK